VCLGEISWMGLVECSLKFSVMSQRNLPRYSRVYFLVFSQNFVKCISSSCFQIIFFDASWQIFSKILGNDTANSHEYFSCALRRNISNFQQISFGEKFFRKYLECVSVNILGTLMKVPQLIFWEHSQMLLGQFFCANFSSCFGEFSCNIIGCI